MSLFALIDCNNFYASCERAFNPRLEKKPIVVLSNNDGCVIARSAEAKQLAIPMGAPYYQWKAFCQKHNVAVFSSNYELYGDMSKRVMCALALICPQIEVYSIDEAFVRLPNLTDLTEFGIFVRKQIRDWIGLPISVGIGPTKTLAKIANSLAKKNELSVFDLSDGATNRIILSQFPVENIWGIGRRLAIKLKQLNIHTAQQLRDANPKMIRNQFSVVVERIVQELKGVSCLALEDIQPRKQIISSRSFGHPLTDLALIEEAISHYAATACVKLRNQKSSAHAVGVFLQTNFYNAQDKQFSRSVILQLPQPTNSTNKIIAYAKQALNNLYKKGYRYNKAGVMLLDIFPDAVLQLDLFSNLGSDTKSKSLMQTIDQINQQLGKETVQFCAEGITKSWQAKCEKRSPRFTTRWRELLTVYAGK